MIFFTFFVQHKRTWENINICVRYYPIWPPLLSYYIYPRMTD